MSVRTWLIGGVLSLGMSATAVGQGINPVPDIDRVRNLYISAAYAEALAAMPLLEGERARPDLEQYRALCLLALGREPEAVVTVERLVRDNPLFVPPAGDTSPRLQSIFSTVRAKVVPDIAKRAYAEGKAAYEAKNREVAHAAFGRTLELIDSMADQEKAALEDLRVLSAGFLELSAARLTTPLSAAPADAAAPAAAEPTGEYVPPAIVREDLPPWNPPDNASRRTEYIGLIRISIGEDGRVQSATIVDASHPAYDILAVNATKQWRYRPATRGGRPVVAQKDLQVRLMPR